MRCIEIPYMEIYIGRLYGSLSWLETVSSTIILMGRYNHSLLLDATIMVSKNCPTIGQHVGTIFVTQ